MVLSPSSASRALAARPLPVLSFWRDEAVASLAPPRTAPRGPAAAGRDGLLAGYRLRVASVLRDYGLETRDEAPPDFASRATLRRMATRSNTPHEPRLARVAALVLTRALAHAGLISLG